MKLHVSLQDDAELRAEVKKIIKGQVLSICKELVEEDYISDLKIRLDKHYQTCNLDSVINLIVENRVRSYLNSYRIAEEIKKSLKISIQNGVDKAMNGLDFEKAIDAAATAKLKSMIK